MIPDYLALVFGTNGGASDNFSSVCAHLQTSLKNVLNEIIVLPSESEQRVALFGPLLGRAVLEITFTALVARIDPFRILALREIQIHASSLGYQYLGERTNAAIQWTGDVRPSETDPNDLWRLDRQFSKYSRSLFGATYGEVFWKDAFTTTIDALNASHQGVWFDELRNIQPESFLMRTRSECDRAYSALSKGVHQEFVVPQTAIYDKPAVLVFIKDALRLAARASLISNAIPTCVGCHLLSTALGHFATAQQLESI